MFERGRKCMSCDCNYIEDAGSKYSKDLNEYVKYLGCCNEKCFFKQTKRKRNRLMFGGFVRDLKGLFK